MNKYNLQVKREILVQVEIEANSPEEALSKYREGDIEEDVVDVSDIGEPLVDLVEESDNRKANSRRHHP